MRWCRGLNHHVQACRYQGLCSAIYCRLRSVVGHPRAPSPKPTHACAAACACPPHTHTLSHTHTHARAHTQFVEVAWSEVVRDSLDPDFVTAFQVTYYFEEAQTVKIQVGKLGVCTHAHGCEHIHTYIHTNIRTYKHTYIHTYTHTSRPYTHTSVTNIHASARTSKHTHVLTCIHAHARTLTEVDTMA
jgi:hypothetical protein